MSRDIQQAGETGHDDDSTAMQTVIETECPNGHDVVEKRPQQWAPDFDRAGNVRISMRCDECDARGQYCSGPGWNYSWD